MTRRLTRADLELSALLARERVLAGASRIRRRRERHELATSHAAQVAAFDRLRPRLPALWAKIGDLGMDEFTTTAWRAFTQQLVGRLLPGVSREFLADPVLGHTMVFTRGGRIRRAEHELVLGHWGPARADDLLREEAVGGAPLIDVGTITSANTLHHLYHATRFARATGVDWEGISTIVEWGGGYGNQARLARRLAGEGLTYVLIDLPVFTALQWLYLASIAGEDAVSVLDTPESRVEPGKVNLVPVGLVREVDVTADMLVSTWALSESTHEAQDHVLSREWFGARHLLLAHQQRSDEFPSAERLGELAVAAGGRSEPVGVLRTSSYVFR